MPDGDCRVEQCKLQQASSIQPQTTLSFLYTNKLLIAFQMLILCSVLLGGRWSWSAHCHALPKYPRSQTTDALCSGDWLPQFPLVREASDQSGLVCINIVSFILLGFQFNLHLCTIYQLNLRGWRVGGIRLKWISAGSIDYLPLIVTKCNYLSHYSL
jgi:hypothetical protein